MPQNKKPFIAGNWKMHMTLQETRSFLSAFLAASPDLADAEIVVLPPFTALAEAAKFLLDTPILIGAQNLFWEDKGAFTGEVSAPMLADLGCRYVVIGHSERRQHFDETDAGVNKKILAALRNGLRPIVCVGETLAERDAGRTFERVESQIAFGLNGLSAQGFREIVVAYEPIWAIGTGKTATPAQAEEVQAHIRRILSEKYGNELATYAIIIYGGSVKPANSYSLFKEKNIDGFLVGGASLEAASFVQIAKEAIRANKEEL
jgi:triosephosphate isomerase (TIM)